MNSSCVTLKHASVEVEAGSVGGDAVTGSSCSMLEDRPDKWWLEVRFTIRGKHVVATGEKPPPAQHTSSPSLDMLNGRP